MAARSSTVQPIIEIFHRILHTVDTAFLLQKIQVPIPFIVSIPECAVTYVRHRLNLIFEKRVGKVIRT